MHLENVNDPLGTPVWIDHDAEGMLWMPNDLRRRSLYTPDAGTLQNFDYRIYYICDE